MPDSTPRQAGDMALGVRHEIEITQEMIDAGVAEFYAADLRFQTAESAVLDIFRAMLSRQTLVRERYAAEAK